MDVARYLMKTALHINLRCIVTSQYTVSVPTVVVVVAAAAATTTTTTTSLIYLLVKPISSYYSPNAPISAHLHRPNSSFLTSRQSTVYFFLLSFSPTSFPPIYRALCPLSDLVIFTAPCCV